MQQRCAGLGRFGGRLGCRQGRLQRTSFVLSRHGLQRIWSQHGNNTTTHAAVLIELLEWKGVQLGDIWCCQGVLVGSFGCIHCCDVALCRLRLCVTLLRTSSGSNSSIPAMMQCVVRCDRTATSACVAGAAACRTDNNAAASQYELCSSLLFPPPGSVPAFSPAHSTGLAACSHFCSMWLCIVTLLIVTLSLRSRRCDGRRQRKLVRYDAAACVLPVRCL